MTKKEQARACKRLKALYTEMDRLSAKTGDMFPPEAEWMRLESLEIEKELGRYWYRIFIAWEHDWKWASEYPGEGYKPEMGRPKRLDDSEVKRLKKSGHSLAKIADKFGVTRGAVQAALKR